MDTFFIINDKWKYGEKIKGGLSNYTEIFLFYMWIYFVEILVNFKVNLKQSVL